MKHQQIYNLEEFANKYQLTDIFGAYAAYFSVGFTLPTGIDVLHHFKEIVQQRTLFTKLLLIRKGTATIVISEQDERKTLNADSLLVMTSRHVINEIEELGEGDHHLVGCQGYGSEPSHHHTTEGESRRLHAQLQGYWPS